MSFHAQLSRSWTAAGSMLCVGLDPDELTVRATYVPSNTLGAKVNIDLIYNFSPVVPVLPDSVKRLVGSAQMRVTY